MLKSLSGCKFIFEGKVGLKVQALYKEDDQYYDATIKDDYQNGSYLVEYDAGGEAELNEDQITGWPEPAAVEAAAPAAGVSANVEFDDPPRRTSRRRSNVGLPYNEADVEESEASNFSFFETSVRAYCHVEIFSKLNSPARSSVARR